MPNCPKCEKPVYFAERVQSLGRDWHRACLRCGNDKCNKTLAAGSHAEHEGKPYCNRCHQALFGPKGRGTYEVEMRVQLLRLAEQAGVGTQLLVRVDAAWSSRPPADKHFATADLVRMIQPVDDAVTVNVDSDSIVNRLSSAFTSQHAFNMRVNGVSLYAPVDGSAITATAPLAPGFNRYVLKLRLDPSAALRQQILDLRAQTRADHNGRMLNERDRLESAHCSSHGPVLHCVFIVRRILDEASRRALVRQAVACPLGILFAAAICYVSDRGTPANRLNWQAFAAPLRLRACLVALLATLLLAVEFATTAIAAVTVNWLRLAQLGMLLFWTAWLAVANAVLCRNRTRFARRTAERALAANYGSPYSAATSSGYTSIAGRGRRRPHSALVLNETPPHLLTAHKRPHTPITLYEDYSPSFSGSSTANSEHNGAHRVGGALSQLEPGALQRYVYGADWLVTGILFAASLMLVLVVLMVDT